MNKPKRIILVRHGESEGNANRAVYGEKPDYTLLLTERGRAQAVEAGRKIKDIIGEERAFFYVSPFFRTRETFENICTQLDRAQFEWREDPRIREQEWGHLRDEAEGAEINKERDAYGTFYFRFPDGESCADVYDRVTLFFDTLHRDFLKSGFPGNVVVVTHGMAIRLFLMRWFHWTVEEFEAVANPDNCAVVEMVLGEKGKYALVTELKKHNVFHQFQRPIRVD